MDVRAPFSQGHVLVPIDSPGSAVALPTYHAEDTERSIGPAAPSLGPLRMLAIHSLAAEPPAESSGVRALFESILQWGILQPLIVRPTGGGVYQVLCGRKRYAAAASAGLGEVPCLIFEGSDADAAALASTSNIGVPAPAAAAIAPPSTA